MTKQEKIDAFNPSGVGDANANIFGLPFSTDEAEAVIIPVPWEVTVSYSAGTAEGPEAIFNASFQVDLYDPNLNDAWKLGIAMDELNYELKSKSEALREQAAAYIDSLAYSTDNSFPEHIQLVEQINHACAEMNSIIKERALHFLKQKKTVGLLGGDHSTPLGLIQALAEHVGDFAILQIDAHADLRKAYEGFEFSHASIMYNALSIPQVKKLVQIGIRDLCEEEFNLIQSHPQRIKTFFDRELKQSAFAGETWNDTCERIINELPNIIYLSFDIDGLDPKLCPHTGTPVAGGFETEQVLYLIEKIVKSGRTIIAFDINEVCPGPEGNEWDANVAARLLYRITNLCMMSQGKKP